VPSGRGLAAQIQVVLRMGEPLRALGSIPHVAARAGRAR